MRSKCRIIFPRFPSEELQDRAVTWSRELPENLLPSSSCRRIRNEENFPNPTLQREHLRRMRQQRVGLHAPPRRPVHSQQRINPTGTGVSSIESRHCSEAASSQIQAQLSEWELGHSSLNPLYGTISELSRKPLRIRKVLLQRRGKEQDIERRSLLTAGARDNLLHFYHPINYGASTSQSTEYGTPEILQEIPQAEKSHESSFQRYDTKDSNSSPEKDEGSSSKRRNESRTSTEISPEKSESNMQVESSPDEDQMRSSSSSPEKSEVNALGIHSQEMYLKQAGSIPHRISKGGRKLTFINVPLSEMDMEESTEPTAIHRISSSKSHGKKREPSVLEKSPTRTFEESKQISVSEITIVDTDTSKRKASCSEQQSESSPQSSPKEKMQKVSSASPPKLSTPIPEVHSTSKKSLGITLKRKKETSSEEEDGSPFQYGKLRSYKRQPIKIRKIKEETDSESGD